jgi:glycosyltransferase involved in cell wall biosynthesis
MKLHLYLKHFPPHQDHFHEGTSKAVHGLAVGLAAQGVAVVILCEGPQAASCDAPAGYRVECFPAPHTSPSFRLSPQLCNYVREQLGPDDLVILNGSFHSSLSALGKLLQQQNVGYIVAPHDVYSPAMFEKKPYLKWPYWFLCEKPLLQAAQAVQVLDVRNITRLRELGITTHSFALPNGFLPIAQTAPNPAPSRKFQLDAPRFMFYGRLDAYHKGLDLLIQGFAAAAPASATLTIQGPDGGDRAALEQLAQKLAPDRIHFLAPNFEAPAEVVLANYDVICMPSRFEGFGLSALEAMLAGRVLLISETAGIAPYITASGCGILIPPTVAGVQSGIAALLNCQRQWEAMGSGGREYSHSHLTWTMVAQQAIAQYFAERTDTVSTRMA